MTSASAQACDPESSPNRAAYLEQARAIAESPDVFALASDTMAQRGYAGDPLHVELLYTIFTSRLLSRPMCAFIKAPSSSGKSWLLNRTLELFPPEAYEIKSGFTPKAIAYGTSDLRHRVLAIQEASGLQGREGNMLVRTLISEGQIRWETTGVTTGALEAREIVRPGPIAFVMTTTHATLHREDETRALSIQVDDTSAHTRRVLDSIADRYSGARRKPVDLAPWHAYQPWLASGPREVAIPFARDIARHYWAQANRSKRDFEQALSAIAVSALMHQARSSRDEDGRVVATLDDYAAARRFMSKVLGEASGAAVPATVRQTVYAIAELAKATIQPESDNVRWPTLTEVADKLGVDKAAASRRVAKAKELGYVIDERIGQGYPSRLAITQRLPADTDVLPPLGHLKAQ